MDSGGGQKAKSARSVELFSGCGGLALGLARAGFQHRVLVERDAHACATIEHNKSRVPEMGDWSVVKDDIRNTNWYQFRGVDLVAGGPPCQPFSIGGKAHGAHDSRDMWPEAIRAVREIQPAAFVFENVRGLMRSAFADYVRWIKQYLSNPHLEIRSDESIAEHLARLERCSGSARYQVKIAPVNAADYGVPQKRHRVVFVGIRTDVGIEPSLPVVSHTIDRLVWDKWISKEYWHRHEVKTPKSSAIPWHEARLVERLRKRGQATPEGLPWITCRDALLGLGTPTDKAEIPNHSFQAGARSYPGHTGSSLDEPAKALKAGVHGVPGGENMLALAHGRVRYFSIREAARLQGLPDEFEFKCSWSEAMRQIGNAVPVQLADVIGQGILTKAFHPSEASYRKSGITSCPIAR